MKKVLVNADLRQQLIDRGLKQVRTLSWETSAQKHLEKIDSSDAYNTIDSINLFYRLVLNAPRTPNMLVFRGDNTSINDNYVPGFKK